MKKRLFMIVAVVLALSLALAACGGGGSSTPPDQPATPEPSAPSGSEPAAEAPLEVIELTMMNHEGPASVTAIMLDIWCDAIAEASGGSLIITPFHGSLGGPRDTYNMVVDGSVDIGFGLASFYPGMFPASDVIALPFLGAQNALQGGHAMQELYDTTDFLKPEYSDVHVILATTNTVAPLITVDKKVEKIEDLRGYNIRTIGGPITEFMKLAGANPMTIDLGEIYTSLEKGVINAVSAVGWEATEATKIYELGNYFLDYEMQVNPTFIIMNQAKYDSLPAAHKAILDEFSGHKAIDVQGDGREQSRQRMYDAIRDQGGEVYQLEPAEYERFKEVGSEASAIWREQVEAVGIDADALEAKCAELFAKYAQEYKYDYVF